MPHVSFVAAFLLCPWPGCGFKIGLIDFRLEDRQDPPYYKRILAAWYLQPEFGLVARCPGCRQYVWFGKDGKRTVSDPPSADLEVLPDDWHTIATILDQ